MIQTKKKVSVSEYFKWKENVVLENSKAHYSIMQSEWVEEATFWAAPSPVMSHSSLEPLHSFPLEQAVFIRNKQNCLFST